MHRKHKKPVQQIITLSFTGGHLKQHVGRVPDQKDGAELEVARRFVQTLKACGRNVRLGAQSGSFPDFECWDGSKKLDLELTEVTSHSSARVPKHLADVGSEIRKLVRRSIDLDYVSITLDNDDETLADLKDHGVDGFTRKLAAAVESPTVELLSKRRERRRLCEIRLATHSSPIWAFIEKVDRRTNLAGGLGFPGAPGVMPLGSFALQRVIQKKIKKYGLSAGSNTLLIAYELGLGSHIGPSDSDAINYARARLACAHHAFSEVYYYRPAEPGNGTLVRL